MWLGPLQDMMLKMSSYEKYILYGALKFPFLFCLTKNAKFYELINVVCKGQNTFC